MEVTTGVSYVGVSDETMEYDKLIFSRRFWWFSRCIRMETPWCIVCCLIWFFWTTPLKSWLQWAFVKQDDHVMLTSLSLRLFSSPPVRLPVCPPAPPPARTSVRSCARPPARLPVHPSARLPTPSLWRPWSVLMAIASGNPTDNVGQWGTTSDR